MRKIFISRMPVLFLILLSGIFLSCTSEFTNPNDPYESEGVSTNANLSDLTVSDGALSPAFSKDTTTYTVDIDQQDIKTGSLYVDCDHCLFYFLVNISKEE